MMQDIKHSIVLITILLASLAQAHSWVEEVDLLAPDGKFTGTVGYPRGMILHSVPGFNDKNMQWQLPANQERQLTADMPMCRESQQTSNYTDPKLQKLVAYPGAAIGLRYQENGHVTTPWSKAGKPQNSGIVYVYGTDQPKEDDHLLDIHNKWTLDGKGGDGRGRLLTSQYFDDGQCYQLNIGYISEQRQAEFPRVAETGSSQGANLWCQTDVPLPKDLAVGKDYTLYWVWDWSTLGNDGKVTLPELYTTCIDVSVSDAGKVAGTGATVADGKDGSAVPFASVTNYGENAIQTVFENLAAMPTVPAAVTPAPVNVTASVSYAAAVTLIQNGAPTSAAVAAGNSAAAAWAVTAGTSGAAGAATTAGTTATAPAAPGPGGPTAGAMVGATTAPPPAASTTSIPATNPPPEPHPTGTGTGDCTSVTVTITIPSTQIQTVTVTATVPPQKAARSTGSLARRRVLALDDDHNDDDYDDDDDEFDS